MTTQTGSPTLSKFLHSPYILERRRNLFPTDEEDRESDLGQPLCSDSGSDIEEIDTSLRLNFCKYDILGSLENTDTVTTPVSNKNDASSEQYLSPLNLSPYTTVPKNSNFSPTQSLKTPNDTSNKNQNAPKLNRKSFLEEPTSLKRKIYPVDSPEQTKILKLDSSSKVRTALFPPEADISLPTRSFYPKMEEKPINKFFISKEPISKPLSFSTSSNTANRHSTKFNRNDGKINNGVRHKIRKPRRKKSIAPISKRAAKNILKCGPSLTEYIQDLHELKKLESEPTEKLIKDIPVKINSDKDQNVAKELEENKENISFVTSIGFQTNQIQKETVTVNNASNHVQGHKKRPISPVEDFTIDQSKKFFKCARSRAVVTMSKNIKLAVDHGKVTLLEGGRKNKKPHLDFDTTDLATYSEDPVLPKAQIESILSSLNEDDSYNKAVSKGNTAPSDTILSPISQMCDVTSGLAINSPKKGRNLNSVLNDMQSVAPNNEKSASPKLFPIFCAGGKTHVHKKEEKNVKNVRRFKKISYSQMLLDAGQKKFGYSLCSQCNILYHIGDPAEESMHQNYHNSESILKFLGWKNEHVVADFNKYGRIIKVMPTDSKIWVKKVKELMEVINRDLGCYEMEFDISKSQVYLFIKNKIIAGCVVATIPLSGGHKMLTSNTEGIDLCSEVSYPIKCGISRIWVSNNNRKQGIATRLLDAVKRNFVFGTFLSDDDVAITAPTEAGAAFARKYFKTPNYLIYYT